MRNATRISTITLFFVAFINQIAYNLVIPVLVPLTDPSSHILFADSTFWPTAWMHGIAIAAFSLSGLISAPFIGYFSDITTRKRVLLFSLLGTLAGFLLLIISLHLQSFTLFVLGRVITGICASSTAVVQAAIIDLHPLHDKAKSLGIIALALTLGMVLGPLLGGLLIDSSLSPYFSLQTPFIATALLIVLNSCLLFLCYQESQQRSALQASTTSFWRAISSLPKATLVGIIGFLLLELSWSYYFFLTPMVLNQYYASSAATIGLFMGMLGIAVCIGLTAAYQLLARFLMPAKILWVNICVMFVAQMVSAIGVPELGYWITSALVAMSLASSYVALLQLISDSSPEGNQGIAMGLCTTMMGLAWTVSGATTNVLFQAYGGKMALIAGFILMPILVRGVRVKGAK